MVNQTLTEYSESLTNLYIGNSSFSYRKKKGQYFTPKKVSEFMVGQFGGVNKKKDLKILDPGAGVGIFESAFCEHLISLKKKLKVSFDLYEKDPRLIPFLKLNMSACKKKMIQEGYNMSYKIINKDFISSTSFIFNNNIYDTNPCLYDFVISNPPYYKLKKKSLYTKDMHEIIKGQPNIYCLFMALSARLLKENGQMTVLTPRSYCSGMYFKDFRKWFFRIVKPLKIHLFDSRKEVFKRYNVIQENVILTATRTSLTPKRVVISASKGIPLYYGLTTIRKAGFNKVITKKGEDVLMRIPISRLDERVLSNIDKLGYTLKSLGFKVSTGQIVPFRTKMRLIKDSNKTKNVIPLIWMQNIVNGKVKWPLTNRKPLGIKRHKKSEKETVLNTNYVLIKRFSTKEGKQRINAAVYLKSLKSDRIGIENHVNYLYKKNKCLTVNEAYGIMALLNSKEYNHYFQITNGNTQVNATELNNLPCPSLKTLILIGKHYRAQVNSAKIGGFSIPVET